MKKILGLFGIVLLLAGAPAWAAVDDGITLTSCVPDGRSGVYVCTIAWANDTGTDIGPTFINIKAGWIEKWETIPDGTNAPTANYDVKILLENDASNGLNLIENITDRSATANEGDRVLFGGAYGAIWTNGTIYPYVSGLTNANDDEGDIILWVNTNP